MIILGSQHPLQTVKCKLDKSFSQAMWIIVHLYHPADSTISGPSYLLSLPGHDLLHLALLLLDPAPPLLQLEPHAVQLRRDGVCNMREEKMTLSNRGSFLIRTMPFCRAKSYEILSVTGAVIFGKVQPFCALRKRAKLRANFFTLYRTS